jgi:ArsR family transcriptional regulator
LRQAGIVEDDKRGNQVYYRLRIPCMLKFFDCVESVLESQAQTRVACLAGGCR